MKVYFYNFVNEDAEYLRNSKQLSQAYLTLKGIFSDKLEAKLINLDNVASKELADFIKAENADINIFCDDILSNKFAIKAASYLDTNVITRIESIGNNNCVVVSKGVYQGHLIQNSQVNNKFGIITLAKVFPQDETLAINEIEKEKFGKSFVTRRYQTYETIIKQTDLSLENSKIVFVGGRGLKTKDNYNRLKAIAEKLGAKCACTRAAAMNDFDSYDNVIGVSGNVLSADLCITFGVSGAGPFVYGIKGVKKIIAVNTDKDALIFDYADMGIIDDCEVVISGLETSLQ